MQQEKQHIAKGLEDKMNRLGLSAKKAATMIGISNAYVSHILNGKWDSISDGKWRTVATWVNNGKWQAVRTDNFQRLERIAKHAQQQSISKAISYRWGTGKSFAAKCYADTYKNVFYMELEPHLTQRAFLRKLCQKLGIAANSSIVDTVDAIVDRLNSLEKPLLILDEIDQAKDSVLSFFKTFYNKCNAGFLLIGGENLRKRIDKGVRLCKQSFQEIFSRLGGEYLPLHPVSEATIASICRANGVDDNKVIQRIINTSNGDLRRMKNEVGKYLLDIQKQQN